MFSSVRHFRDTSPHCAGIDWLRVVGQGRFFAKTTCSTLMGYMNGVVWCDAGSLCYRKDTIKPTMKYNICVHAKQNLCVTAGIAYRVTVQLFQPGGRV